MNDSEQYVDDSHPRAPRLLTVNRVLVGCTLLLAMAVFGLRSFLVPTGIQKCTMPDGTVLVLQDVTFGEKHSITIRDRSLGWLGFLGLGTGSQTIDTYTPPNRIVLWFRRYDPRNGEALDFNWWSHCLAEDGAGHLQEDGHPGCDACHKSWGRSGNTSELAGARPLEAIPHGEYTVITAYSSLPTIRHAGPTFKLFVYNIRNEKVAEFDVPNPHPVDPPQWVPEPLPITRLHKDIAVTLQKVRISESTSNAPDNRPNARLDIWPEFQTTRNGQPTDLWKVDQPMIFDALGNVSKNWDCDLSTAENSWKLQSKIYRRDHAEFAPEEIWAIKGIEIPAPNTSRPLSLTKTVQGVTFEITAIGGSGTVEHVESIPMSGGSSKLGSGSDLFHEFDHRKRDAEYRRYHATRDSHAGVQRTTVEGPVPHLVVKLSGNTEDHRFGLRGPGIRTQELKRSRDSGDYWFLDIAPDVKTLDLEILVHQAENVEFLIKPQKDEKQR